MREIPDIEVRKLKRALDELKVSVCNKSDGYNNIWHSIVGFAGRAMFAILWVFSFGKFQKSFTEDFVTTIGDTIYLGTDYEHMDLSHPTLYTLVRHELIHVLQSKKYWAWFGLSYVLVLPTLFTMRYKWEMEAYTQSMVVRYEVDGEIPEWLIDTLARKFVSPDYFFMTYSKGKAKKDLEGRADKIRRGDIRGLHPYNKSILD